MGLLNVDLASVGQTLAKTAAGKAAQAVAQSMSPKLVQDVQRVLSVGGFAGQLLGIKTGIGALDGILGLGGSPREAGTPLLGGLSLRQAQTMYEQVSAARVARKNLFFLRILDTNQPKGVYPARSPASGGGLAGLIESRIGPAIGTVMSGISGAVSSIGSAVGGPLGGVVGNMVGGALGLSSGSGSNSISNIALSTFDLLAMDVSYGASISGDHIQVGSSFIDRPTGRDPSEVQITTMDDEAGSIKRWFDGKLDQIARKDGTMGLPAEYLVTIEVVHAIPSAQVPGFSLAYKKVLSLRPASIQHELSRRDQALSELQMTFAQHDYFMK